MGFALHPYSDWLVIISLNEVLKVGGIQKSQVIRQAEFSRAFGARLLAPSALVFSRLRRSLLAALPREWRLRRQDYARNTIPPATQAKANVDMGFDKEEIKKLTEYGFYAPSDVLKATVDGTLDFDEYNEIVGKKIKKLGQKKGSLSGTKKNKQKNRDEIDELTKEIKLLRKYKDRIKIIPEGKKTIGKGYTQPKRNA